MPSHVLNAYYLSGYCSPMRNRTKSCQLNWYFIQTKAIITQTLESLNCPSGVSDGAVFRKSVVIINFIQ